VPAKVAASQELIVVGDFTFRFTLGVIPDPNSVLVVFLHESTFRNRWKINWSELVKAGHAL